MKFTICIKKKLDETVAEIENEINDGNINVFPENFASLEMFDRRRRLDGQDSGWLRLTGHWWIVRSTVLDSRGLRLTGHRLVIGSTGSRFRVVTSHRTSVGLRWGLGLGHSFG